MAFNNLNSFLCAMQLVIVPMISRTLSPGELGSFADLSGTADRRTDIIIYNDNQIKTFISINDRDSNDPQFSGYHDITTDYNITSISIGDKNHDGIADLFVLTETSLNNQYQLDIYQDSENSNDFEQLQMSIQLSDPNVLVIDGNGDFTPDIFGKQQGIAGFFFLNKDSNEAFFRSLAINSDENDNIIMQSVSFIDLDQDCRADLVYITNQGQLKMIKGTNFEVNQELEPQSLEISLLPYQQHRMFFADINKDGAIDIIVPGKYSNEIYIWTQRHNLNFKNICNKNNDVILGWDNNSQKMLKLKMSSDGDDYNLTESSIIVVGDINMDSNINFIATLENNNGDQKVFVAKLTDSVSDGDEITNIDEISNKFENLMISSGQRRRIRDIAFFHSGEFPLGVHFLVQFEDKSFAWINLKDLLKNKNYGFLSVLPLNDAPTNSVKRYGGTMSGAMIKAFYRARDGKSIFLTSPTLYQSNKVNHLLPFVFLGLGEPESYIEKLVISYSMYDVEEYTLSQPGVPPNSELVLYAHPRDNRPSWRLETFLAPYLTPQTLAIIITITMSILGGFWLYLEIKEKKEITDEKLKAGSATTNNFFF